MSFEQVNDLSICAEFMVTNARRREDEPKTDFDLTDQQVQHIASPVLGSVVEVDWMNKGSCKGLPSGFMFPEYDDEGIEAAKEVCQGCPVKIPCLADALDNREIYGVRGGLSELERSKILRQRKRDADRQVAIDEKTKIA